jgi:hypothetical protein
MPGRQQIGLEADALGLSIPQTLPAAADEVIE